MRTSHRIALALVLGLFASHALAQDRVYRWTNKDGVTQYTQTPPASGEYENVRIGSSGQQRAAAQSADASRDPAGNAGDSAPTAADLERQEYCALAQRNLATLSSSAPVHFESDDGDEPAPMSNAQRSEQVAIAERQVALFCVD